MPYTRLTVAQATVKFLGAQRSERDGRTHKLIEAVFGIFGHGNVAGLGQALLEEELRDPGFMPYRQGRNEQAMVHTAVAFSKTLNRLSTMACTTSVGPGATNMVTGAALATVNRIPVLLLPSDTFAARTADPVLQQLENFSAYDVTVNDAFRPVSRYFDRINRPEQLAPSLLAAMRVLTDPADCGAVTIALPQDVQTQAHDFPNELFEERIWPIPRQRADKVRLAEACSMIKKAKRPLVIAGGGVIYSEATEALSALAFETRIPCAETQAGKGSLVWDHPANLGAIGATGTTAANAVARDADLVIGIGTRWSDFTTASHSAFQNAGVRFININTARFDSTKMQALSLVGDAKETLDELAILLRGHRVSERYQMEYRSEIDRWNELRDRAASTDGKGNLTQSQIIAEVNEVAGEKGVVVCAAGSIPGDLHKLWRCSNPKGYHVEYGYSCMGYEIAGGVGVKLASPDREVYVMVGDGSYLMMAQELVTAVQEHLKIVVVIVDNHGYSSIGSLSESVGSQRFGTQYRFRGPSGRLDGDNLPVDLASNAESLGMKVYRVADTNEFRVALASSVKDSGPVAIWVETDGRQPAPDSQSWWDVPVAAISKTETATTARSTYESSKRQQRHYL